MVMVDIVPVDSYKYKVDAAHTHTQSAVRAQPAGLLLHFKVFRRFLFVRSQLEAQSISISLHLQPERSTAPPLAAIWSQILLLTHS